MKRRGGFTLVEILVVISILGILLSFLVPAVIGMRARAFDRRAQAGLQALEVGVQQYVARYNTVPPLSGATPPAADPTYGATTTNYIASAYLHHWLGSRLDSGEAALPRFTDPLLAFVKSDASTWRELSDAAFAARYDAVGRVASPGFLLDPWGRAIAYVPIPAGAGDHTAALFPRPGACEGRAGRNLTGFVQLWSRGSDGTTPLPGAGPAGPAESGDGDDLTLWFLPYY